MVFDHDKLQIVTGGIVETARKDAGMTQGQLAEAVGVIQSTISRIEQGVLAPTLFHWIKMCEVLNIPEEALSVGSLDRNTVTKITSGIKEGLSTLPKAYSDLKCIKVRNYLPTFCYITEEFGEDTLEKIFADLKLRPNFFLNLDNQVNLNFADDFLITLGKYQKVDGRTMGRIVQYVASPKSHGVLARHFNNASDQLDLMDRYLRNITKYHRVFFLENYHIDDEKITFSAAYPEENEAIFDKMGEEKDEFLWQYYMSWMKKFSLYDYKNKYGTHKEIHIESTTRDKNGIRHVTITTAP